MLEYMYERVCVCVFHKASLDKANYFKFSSNSANLPSSFKPHYIGYNAN